MCIPNLGAEVNVTPFALKNTPLRQFVYERLQRIPEMARVVKLAWLHMRKISLSVIERTNQKALEALE